MMLKGLSTSTLAPTVRGAAPRGLMLAAPSRSVGSAVVARPSRANTMPCQAVFKGQDKVRRACVRKLHS